MQLCWCRSRTSNFGDDINSWLWHELLPDTFTTNGDSVMLGIGTIIDIPTTSTFPNAKNWIVFGSGVGYGVLPDFRKLNWQFAAVRGPLSARILGLSADRAVTDGAILVADHRDFTPLPESEREGVVFMPHHSALAAGQWERVCEEAGVEFLNPLYDSRALVKRIRSARLVLADAMHAAILADSMRVPWVPLVTSPEISTFKWLDWTMSMGIDYKPIRLPHSCLAEKLRSETLNWYGEVYQSSTEPDDALQSLLLKQRMKSSFVGRVGRKLGRVTYSAVVKPLAKQIVESSRGNIDPPYLKAAVHTLREAQIGPAYVSSDQMYRAKLDLMRERLSQVRDFARLATQNTQAMTMTAAK